MGIILGIETSTHIGSIAVRIDGELKEERSLSQTGRRHAQTLVSEIRDLFRNNNISPTDCDRVAVSIGPGSFTGLRVGVVFAKLMAYSSKCQLVPIDTMLAIAENSPDEIQNISVITNAQRGDLFLGKYERNQKGLFNCMQDICIVSGTNWASNLSEQDRITGNGISIIEEEIPFKGITLPEELWLPNAGTIAFLGEVSNIQLPKNEMFALEPFYLRKSAAEEKKEKENIPQ